MMLLFVVLLYFGLKILSLSAARTSGTDIASTHICVDYQPRTNETIVKWAVSSAQPISIVECELGYSEVLAGGQGTTQVLNALPSHGSRSITDLQKFSTWDILVTCTLTDGRSPQSPILQVIPGLSSSSHQCSDSGLQSLVPSGTDTPVFLCIWRPELNVSYAVVRWQPTSSAVDASASICVLQREVNGQVKSESGLPVDDMLYFFSEGDSLSAWVTCNTSTGVTFSSGKAQYSAGSTSMCSLDASSPSPPHISDGHPTDSSEGAPAHRKLGVTNMAMGLSLGAAILIGGTILTIVFARWFRWQRRRRRERLIRNGEAASDQSAMEEFQQMM